MGSYRGIGIKGLLSGINFRGKRASFPVGFSMILRTYQKTVQFFAKSLPFRCAFRVRGGELKERARGRLMVVALLSGEDLLTDGGDLALKIGA